VDSSRTKSPIGGWLEHPRAGGVVVALGLLLALPSLSLGFFSDDYTFIDYLERRVAFNSPWWDLYRFTPGDPTEVRRLIALGQYPWWTTPDLRMHFVRPIPSALFALDHAVFGRNPVLWHVHSLLWFGALLLAANALFRRLLPAATATVALLLFALSDAGFAPSAWLSARHHLLAALFSALGLLAHVRWRTEGWKPGRPLALLSFVVALLCGEAALGALALAFAYEVLGTSEPPLGSRVVRGLPFAGLAIAYLSLYSAFGCGGYGGAGYLSPLSEPVAFVLAAAKRFPIFLADAVLGTPAEAANLESVARPLVVVGLVAAALYALLLRAVLRHATDGERAAVKWLLPGALVAMSAGLGGFPGARELMIPNFGLSPTLAVVLVHGFAAGRGALARRVGAGFLALVHIGLAPIMQLGNERTLKQMAIASAVVTEDARRETDARGGIRILQASDPMVGMYPGAILAAETDRRAACGAWISGVQADVIVERTGPRSFTVAPKGTTFLKGAFEDLFRASWHPLAVGYEQPVCGAVVRVVALEGGLPSRIEVTADADLDAPSGGWVAWQSGALRPFAFPPIGSTTEIGWSPGPMGMF
jgi:hypothetical protein